MTCDEVQDEAVLMLPWHVNNTLSPATRWRMRLALALSHELRVEAKWLSAMRSHVDSLVPAAEPEKAWGRLRLLMAAEHASAGDYGPAPR